MKLLSFLAADGVAHAGVLLDSSQKILDLTEYFRNTNHGPVSMLQIIEKGDSFLEEIEILLSKSSSLDSKFLSNEASAKILCPVPKPLSLRDGYAFRQHVEAARRNRGVPMIEEFDHFPIFYFSNHLQVSGPGPIRVMPKALEKLDFELEVAIVTGKKCRNLTPKNADDAIFGYMIWNDWSARALQMEEMKLNLGPAKGKDFANSFGPYLIPRKYLKHKLISTPAGEKYDLRMRAFLNGEKVSEGNVKDMTWTFAQILERVSYGVTLMPGEIIGSGTVGTGCFLELNGTFKDQPPRWIKPGDEMVLEIDELGRLVNTIQQDE